jgi:hypothetical protein
MVRCAKEADGYDREAYEHEIELGRMKYVAQNAGPHDYRPLRIPLLGSPLRTQTCANKKW